MLNINSRIRLGYSRLIQGVVTSEEYFLYDYGVLNGLELAGINTNIQKQILEDLKYQYEHIPYKIGRAITDEEQEILNKLI